MIAEALEAWPRRHPRLERMAWSVGTSRRWETPPAQAGGTPRPAIDPAMLERLRGYPAGVSDTEPGHACAVQSLMQASEPVSAVTAAYRAIKYADEARRELGLGVAGLRDVVMRSFAA